MSADINLRGAPDTASPKRNSPITYSKRSQSAFSSAFVDPVEGRVGNDATVETAPSNQASWNLEGTIRDNYARHDPMVLFPEPSSTVPNATLTQQRVLEGVMAPAMLGDSEVEAPHYRPPSEPPVPWSDIIKFSSATTGEQSEPTNHDHSFSNVITAAPLGTPREMQEPSTSQRSRLCSSVRLRDSPLRTELHYSPVEPEQSKGTEACPIEQPGILPVESSNSHSNTPEEFGKSSLTRKTQIISVPSSDDDLAAMGLPIEQYKPRPSRSRSLKVEMEQPIDYSARPEKAKKKVSRRRKTTAAVSDTSALTTPQKIQQICDMGFTPSTTGRALERNNGDVTQTVDWLVRNGIGEDELASHTTPKKKSGKASHNTAPVDYDTIQGIMRGLNEYSRLDRESVQNAVKSTMAISAVLQAEPANNNSNMMFSTTDQPPNGAQVKSPKIQVVIPKISPKSGNAQSSGSGEAPSKKLKRRKTTLDQPEPESPLQERIVPKAVPEKKRGRGRPKKVANTALSADTVLEVPEESIQKEQHHQLFQSIEPDLTAPPSASTESQPSVTPNGAQAREPESHRDEAPIVEPPPSPIASRTPEVPTKHMNQSPNNKSKVPHRVGLSKRARIAPLLRTLKK